MHACKLLTSIFFVDVDELLLAMVSLQLYTTLALSGIVQSGILRCTGSMVNRPRVSSVFRAKTVCL